MSLGRIFNPLKWLTIGIIVLIICALIQTIPSFLGILETRFENLMVTILFARSIIITFIVTLVGIWLFHRTRMKLGGYIAIRAILIGGLLFGLSYLELIAYEVLGNAKWVLIFDIELICTLFLSIVLSGINFSRWKKKKRQEMQMQENFVTKPTHSWIVYLWMLVVSGLINIIVTLAIGELLWGILIIPVGTLILSICFERKLRNIVVHGIKLFVEWIKSRLVQLSIWFREIWNQKNASAPEETQEVPKLLRWRASVRITQLPAMIDQDQIVSSDPHHPSNTMTGIESNSKIWEMVDSYETWLRDYLNFWHVSSYFVEFICGNGLQIRIGTLAESEVDAKVRAGQIQLILAQNFPDVESEIECIPIFKKTDVLWDSQLMEIKLPNPPYRYPLPLVRNIAYLSTQLAESEKVRVLICYQKAPNSDNLGTVKIRRRLDRLVKKDKLPQSESERIRNSWSTGTKFNLNVYYQLLHETPEAVKSIGNALISDLKGADETRARLRSVPQLRKRKVAGGHLNFITCVRINPINSGFHLNHKFPMQRAEIYAPSGIVPISDVESHNPIQNTGTPPVTQQSPQQSQQNTIPENLDLVEIPQSPSYLNGIVEISQNNEARFIIAGTYLFGNVHTKMGVPLEFDNLDQHMCVFGKTRTGKSTFLAYLKHEIQKADPTITSLIFGLKDGLDQHLFRPCLTLGHDNENLRIPFYIPPFPGENPSKIREEMARIISAALGLLDNTDNYILNYMTELDEEGISITKNYKTFMYGVIDYLDRNKYGESHGDIYRAVSEHVKKLRDKRFLEVVEAKDEIPDWFKIWLGGGEKSHNGLNPGFNTESKTIYLDLVQFSETEKRFIVLCILQMIRRFTKPNSEQRLQRLLIVDEAHIVFEAPDQLDYLSSRNLGQNEMNNYVKRMIDELGKTGTSLVFADQNMQNVLPSIFQQVTTRVIFQVSNVSADIATHDLRLANLLTKLPRFHAHITAFTNSGKKIDAIMKTKLFKPIEVPNTTQETSKAVKIDSKLETDESIQVNDALYDGKGLNTNGNEIRNDLGNHLSDFYGITPNLYTLLKDKTNWEKKTMLKPNNNQKKDTTLFDDAVRMVREEQYLRAFYFLSERLWNRLRKLYNIYPLPKFNCSADGDFYLDGQKYLKGLIAAIIECLDEKETWLGEESDEKLLDAIKKLEGLWERIRSVGIEQGMILMTVDVFQESLRWLERIDFEFQDKFKETAEIEAEWREIEEYGYDYSFLYEEADEKKNTNGDNGEKDDGRSLK